MRRIFGAYGPVVVARAPTISRTAHGVIPARHFGRQCIRKWLPQADDGRTPGADNVPMTTHAQAGTSRVIYTAGAAVTGGRAEGHGRTSDGALDVQLRLPEEMGGQGGGTNPEQLFAVGYAACFESALGAVARREHTELGDVVIGSRVSLAPGENRTYKLAAELDVELPGL